MRTYLSWPAAICVALALAPTTPGLAATGPVAPSVIANAGQVRTPAPAAARLPPEVATWMAEKRRDCREAGGRFGGFGASSGFYLTGEFNGDGRTDYILQEAAMDCPHPDGRADGAMGYGRAGPPNDFLVSGPAGYRIAGSFSSYLEQRQIERRGTADVVVIEGNWNMEGGAVVKVVWGWDGTEIAPLERYGAAGERVDQHGYPLPAPRPPVTGTVGIVPIPAGHYAVNMSCAEAAREAQQGLGPGPPYLYLSATEWLEWDGGPQITSIRKLGPQSYQLAMRYEDEEGTPITDTTDIRITGPAKFTDGNRNFAHCPLDQVPRDFR